MDLKYKAIIAGVLLVVAFAFGRYSAPTKTITETKIVKEVVKEEVVHTVTRVVERPDGTKETDTTTDSDTNTHTDITRERVKEIFAASRDLNVSVLIGGQPHMFKGISIGPIVYGASVTRTIIGPVTVGFFGMSDFTVGASLGLNF